MPVETTSDAGGRLQRIWKRFPGVVALRDVTITLRPGEVHALVGQNGGGKSTLVQVLSGAVVPEAGKILHGDREVQLSSPLTARLEGVGTIFQEFSLVGSLSVAENIAMGIRAKAHARRVNWAAMRAQAGTVLADLGVRLDVDMSVDRLPKAEQQFVEIAKALVANPTLLILDEPTTALSLGDAARLRTLVRQLSKAGRCVLYISHRLEELPGFADTVTALRDGVVVASISGAGLHIDEVIHAMLGADSARKFTKSVHIDTAELLRLEGVSARNGARDVTLTLHRGEVLGLAGVTGSGRTEIVRAIVGADRLTSGTLTLGGKRIRPKSPKQAVRLGIGLLPESRASEGLFFNFTGGKNMTTARLRALRRWVWLNLSKERRDTEALAAKLQTTAGATNQRPGFLSGGNQQKLVLGRWLFARSEVLCLDEPTQGIDIGAKVQVYQLIDDLATAGVGVILISSEQSELLEMSDRIAIVRNHSIETIRDASTLDEFSLASLTAGAGT